MISRNQLEIFRMMLYLTFPVAIFWTVNQTEFFEKYAIASNIFQPLNEEQKKDREAFRKRLHEMNEKKMLEMAKK
ncbi:protein PET100 homolog, mitochondrial [Protobothrops mucrosquamatus]|uniref:protein PET100 homolog, mitochondrial n=1 Tax=Protobothrops mucrosquamatus TaxID=103944 RepID=UPI000775BF7F|nr:protein PET100 homolog, mitochondrial [Protobothrops mucrosquamatus]